jgi:serine O-acetyltransferase
MAARTRSAAEGKVSAYDPIWSEIRKEAQAAMAAEPALGSFIYATVLSHDRLEEAICHRLAQRLDHSDVDAVLINQTFQAVRDFALFLQSQGSRTFGVDIHPAARFGQGIMIDHATGVVVGETAVVGNNCSFLHAVTLGGSGKETGDRHPKIGENVLIGAGAKVLGNITVGDGSRIAAGSVVLTNVPAHVTVAGVPAKVVGSAGCAEPALEMEQTWVDDFGGL